MATVVKAGFGKGTIRFPDSLFPVEGFTGVHDDPHARLMVLETEAEQMALLAVELVNIPRSAVAAWREQISTAFGIPLEKIWVHMTHAITTPHEPGPMGPPDKRPAPTAEDERKKKLFHEVANAAVAEAIEGAKADLSEARLGWGTGTCNANVNRDVETPYGWWIGKKGDGPSNHTMTLLRVDGLDGAPKGFLISYGLKPCAVDNAGMRDGTRLVSAEVCGACCNQVEEAYGVPTLYCMSAAGDQIPAKTAFSECVDDEGQVHLNDEGPEQGFVYLEELSREMSGCALAIAKGITCDEEVEQAGWANVSFRWEKRKGGRRVLSKELASIPDGEMEVTSEVFRLGNAAFVAVRPEVTTPVEADLLARSPYAHTILLSMTNGEMKYLTERAAFERGTWEAQSCMLMPGAAEKLVDEVVAKLDALK